jgi:hypothetical protein
MIFVLKYDLAVVPGKMAATMVFALKSLYIPACNRGNNY